VIDFIKEEIPIRSQSLEPKFLGTIEFPDVWAEINGSGGEPMGSGLLDTILQLSRAVL
jgi:hypothetical protein